jgi:hypothetical protein
MKLLAALLPAGLLLTACATLDTNVQTRADLTQLRRVWVQQSTSDNHSLDALIVRQFRERGIQAESGPLTLMPTDVKVYVTYEDHWDWELKDYLIALSITLRDARSDELMASAAQRRPMAFLSQPSVMVKTVLDTLLKAHPAPVTAPRPPPPPPE